MPLTLRPSLLLIVIAVSLAFAQARAEAPTRVKKTTITVKESEKDGDEEPTPTPTPPEEKERVKTATFGSKSQTGTLGCKTEESIKEVIKGLKTDCAAWVKDQKADLKSRFLTSSCEESCSDCGMSLQRCTVVGTIHYIIK